MKIRSRERQLYATISDLPVRAHEGRRRFGAQTRELLADAREFIMPMTADVAA